jgi:hypothetical protein
MPFPNFSCSSIVVKPGFLSLDRMAQHHSNSLVHGSFSSEAHREVTCLHLGAPAPGVAGKMPGILLDGLHEPLQRLYGADQKHGNR